jgi:hypothetical protein
MCFITETGALLLFGGPSDFAPKQGRFLLTCFL